MDGFSIDYASHIRWILNAKDVLISKVSVDREGIKEGEGFEILFSFKSFFTKEILLVVDESSILFNYQDV